MSRRRKLEKFAELLKYPHVFEMVEIGSGKVKQSKDEIFEINGQWNAKAFKNNQPLCLELACGRGEYTLALARLYAETNYIGIDIKGSRIHTGATIALKEQITNVAFLRIRIEQLENYFDPGEVNEIWITFPDPFAAKPNRRLTAPRFLDVYHKILPAGSFLHLKTDDGDLFDYSVEMAELHPGFEIREKNQNISDLRQERAELNITTYYEKRHLQDKKTIKYLQLVKID